MKFFAFMCFYAAMLSHMCLANSMDVQTTLTHGAIPRNLPTQIATVFHITPKSEQTEEARPPYDLYVVLDRSGSMNGAPLENSKQAILNIIDRLGPKDRLSLVQYSSTAQTVFSQATRSEQNRLTALVKSIRSSGSTNMWDGILKVADIVDVALQEQSDEKRLQKMFMFSDGAVNVGVTHTPTILSAIKKLLQRGVSTSSFGLGTHFNRELMTAIAEHGQGDFFFIEGPGDIDRFLNTAHAGVAKTIGTNAFLEVTGLEDDEIKATITDSFGRGEIKENKVRIPVKDLRVTGERIFEIGLNIEVKGKAESAPILRWKLEYLDVETKETNTVTGVTTVRIVETKEEYEASKDNDSVMFWKLAKQTNELIKSMNDVGKNDWRGAQDKLKSIAAQLRAMEESEEFEQSNNEFLRIGTQSFANNVKSLMENAKHDEKAGVSGMASSTMYGSQGAVYRRAAAHPDHYDL